jgi:CTP synthase
MCRCDREIPDIVRSKIALFCNLREPCVIPVVDVSTIYKVPLACHEQGLDARVCEYFGLTSPAPDLSRWRRIVQAIEKPEGSVHVAVVGKYVDLRDSYKSLEEALLHAGVANNTRVNVDWIDSEMLENDDSMWRLQEADGIIVPGGFGERGTTGMIRAIELAREHRVPFFGICFGMQLAVVEAARNLAKLPGASSTEFRACQDPVVGLMTEWTRGNEREYRQANGDLGGTMRLGAFEAVLDPNSRIAKIYGRTRITERHRHRYEININYRGRLEAVGVKFSGLSPDGKLPETLEIPNHPWFIGVQYHPELKSKPFDPHPVFKAFVGAVEEQSRLV